MVERRAVKAGGAGSNPVPCSKLFSMLREAGRRRKPADALGDGVDRDLRKQITEGQNRNKAIARASHTRDGSLLKSTSRASHW